MTPQPNQITSGPDGELYVTDTGNGAIYSIDPTSHVISQPNFIGKTVISNPLPSGITTGPDGNLWFTDDGQQAATPTVSGAVGVVDRLAIATQPPARVTAGAGFGFTVNIETAGDAIDSSYNGNVTVAIANNPGGSTLGGTLTVAASQWCGNLRGADSDNGRDGLHAGCLRQRPDHHHFKFLHRGPCLTPRPAGPGRDRGVHAEDQPKTTRRSASPC